MFITVTRFGGSCALRVAAAAIAYIGEMPEGVRLQLLSGEHMHVEGDVSGIEQSIVEALAPPALAEIEGVAVVAPACSAIEAKLSAILDRLAPADPSDDEPEREAHAGLPPAGDAAERSARRRGRHA